MITFSLSPVTGFWCFVVFVNVCQNFVDVGAFVYHGRQCFVVFDDACWCACCFNMQSISTIDSYIATLLQPALLLSLIQRH